MIKSATSTRRHFFKFTAAAFGAVPLLGISGGLRAWKSNKSRSDRTDPNSMKAQSSAIHCFLTGTHILTPHGDIKIENLAVGDRVCTDRGDSRPIKWIGRVRFERTAILNSQLPVCISRHALASQTPREDLYVSPAHCLYLDGVLIPSEHLVNDISIFRALPDRAQAIEYFHLEFEEHEVIYAEGVATESLLLTSDREEFENGREYARLHGIEANRPMIPYAQILRYDGGQSELKALLRRLAFPVVDVRDPIQRTYDQICDRALDMAA